MRQVTQLLWTALIGLALAVAAGKLCAQQEARPGDTLFREGVVRYKAGDYAGAARLFMKSAEAGHARAQLQIGSQYERGEGLVRNYAEAARWYAMSAKQGDATALTNLGNMYELGKGVQENWSSAAKLYYLAAQKGDPDAQYALGRLYQFGMGVPQSRADAVAWFRRAAAQGDREAADQIRWLSDPTNFIGFRNAPERATVLDGGLRFGLSAEEPTGRTFRDSSERNAYVVCLRQWVDYNEALSFYEQAERECSSRGGCGGNPAPRRPPPPTCWAHYARR